MPIAHADVMGHTDCCYAMHHKAAAQRHRLRPLAKFQLLFACNLNSMFLCATNLAFTVYNDMPKRREHRLSEMRGTCCAIVKQTIKKEKRPTGR
jgi:hypothetical protein